MTAQPSGSGPVLMVVSAADHLVARDGSRLPTGFWASEVLEPYEVLTAAGYDVVIATPGAEVPSPDERSLDEEGLRERLAAVPGVQAPAALAQCEDVDAFAAVLLPGGHGPMADLYGEPDLGRILRGAISEELPIAAICHGPAGLLSTQQDPTSPWPLAGKVMTAFRDAEEEAAGLADKLPWSLERLLTDAGAKLALAEPFEPQVVVDGVLVTGQNPASARPATEALVDVLASRG